MGRRQRRFRASVNRSDNFWNYNSASECWRRRRRAAMRRGASPQRMHTFQQHAATSPKREGAPPGKSKIVPGYGSAAKAPRGANGFPHRLLLLARHGLSQPEAPGEEISAREIRI
uniref:Uncharacterized protein n=1 Tax=Steinernema glaseri TaxID=37863 RepID=A0A1I7YW96_9BILA